MTDRELLEGAAKAAGIDGWWSGNDYCYGYGGNLNVPIPWNPLTDAGDALRLAVKLNFDIYQGDDDGPAAYVGYYLPGTTRQLFAIVRHEGDATAATRRAIVRAAYEISRSMTT